jgi:hypothetical protein
VGGQRPPVQYLIPKRLKFLISRPFQHFLAGREGQAIRFGALGEHALPEQISF